jgi:hypothetical protein
MTEPQIKTFQTRLRKTFNATLFQLKSSIQRLRFLKYIIKSIPMTMTDVAKRMRVMFAVVFLLSATPLCGVSLGE